MTGPALRTSRAERSHDPRILEDPADLDVQGTVEDALNEIPAGSGLEAVRADRISSREMSSRDPPPSVPTICVNRASTAGVPTFLTMMLACSSITSHSSVPKLLIAPVKVAFPRLMARPISTTPFHQC